MRKYHRWLSVLFGVFLLWIATTGVMSQFADIVAESQERPAAGMAAQGTGLAPSAQAHEEPSPAATVPAAATKPGAMSGFVCPPDFSCRPKPAKDSAQAWVGYLHHLHSGEQFGPFGTAISILSGFALMFFAFSGLWMYTRMWSHRRDKDHKPAWFWK